MSVVRGWCPSAHRPMMSGDGLLVRVKPRMGRLTAGEVLSLCDLAERFGSGLIDVTSRANLQVRGVAEVDHPALLAGLMAAGLVEADASREATRNVVVTPFWRPGDLTERLFDTVVKVLARFDLPAKVGVAIDTGAAPVLSDVSGDFRFEAEVNGGFLLRADGADRGHVVSEAEAEEALSTMVQWFLDTGGAEAGRMARHLRRVELPDAWDMHAPAPNAGRPEFGKTVGGRMFGVPFGSTDAESLRQLLSVSGATALRVTPWRMLFLEGASEADVPGLLSGWDRVMEVSACPGAPLCPQATVITRDLARALAKTISGTLHVSGCAKGCARPSEADITIVGRDGRFDLVRNGRAGDTPVQTGLNAADLRLLEV